MEDNVGGTVGENCLECCLLESPPNGRMSGLSGTLRLGEVHIDGLGMGEKEELLKPEGRLGLFGEVCMDGLPREGLLREEESEGLLVEERRE